MMPKFFTLSCPSCGHSLQITQDTERFFCSACGNEHLVIEDSQGEYSLKPVRKAVENLTSEMAIARLEKEVTNLQARKVDLEKLVQNVQPSDEIGRLMVQKHRIPKPNVSFSGSIIISFFLDLIIFQVILSQNLTQGRGLPANTLLLLWLGTFLAVYFGRGLFQKIAYDRRTGEIDSRIVVTEESDRMSGNDIETRKAKLVEELKLVGENIKDKLEQISFHRSRIDKVSRGLPTNR